MRLVASAALLTLISTPAFCADLVITKSKHQDALKMPGMDRPAQDSTEITWVGKDRMRMEDGDHVTIVRADLKKMYMLDVKAKTVSTVDLPFDMKKYLPPEMAPMMEKVMGQMKVTVTPTTETKKIKDWTVTKYTMSMTQPMGGFTQDIWATKDVQVDRAAFNDLSGSIMSAGLGGSSIAAEYKKIEGVTVLTERTQTIMGQNVKSREEVTAIETKDATEGLYDVPKGYTEKPFDPMAESPMKRDVKESKPGGAPPPPEKK
jgi:hypothetical protein